jgi:hypothetical protein
VNYDKLGLLLFVGEFIVSAVVFGTVVYKWEMRNMRPKRVPTSLLVMRLEDMGVRHPDQDDTHVCSECEEKVGIYPSGQAVLEKYPNIKIICSRCAEITVMDIFESEPAPGAIQEALEGRRRKNN